MGDGSDWILARARGVDDVNTHDKEMGVSTLQLDRGCKNSEKVTQL